MTKNQIDELISEGVFPEPTEHRKLLETHISWVILCDRFVYKIKKPIKYSFLDFSTLERRKHFYERELVLNRRYSGNIYLGVLPIYEFQGQFIIGGDEGRVVEYALKMSKLDPEKQMDVLVSQNKVSNLDIVNLARYIADFHEHAKIIYDTSGIDIGQEFNDLAGARSFLTENLGSEYGDRIDSALKASGTFLRKNKKLLEDRLKMEFYRDVHGDLHTRNIFLLPDPQPFDCIEFNDKYRQIDVLNEVAFLCMDLDALDRNDLSELFIEQYNRHFPAIRNDKDKNLFIYYKAYRANVRAKVNSLRANSASNSADRKRALSEVKRYFELMEDYLCSLK
ncbi:hypothetical protein RQM65_15430 [Pricia sp. S334]|uniref:Aminoglycoside phosphotransferase domain-containing protein n=1 Tax=Pricia mediterranea TaxID=3076079 RepID=A0ABU3L8J8_9FLAO|nr:hypothetical protein [Pricia sp. S334]MDT7830059.1 hypothetical protein [Pricia sp. S334]